METGAFHSPALLRTASRPRRDSAHYRVAGCPTGWKESLNGKNWELTTWFRVTCWRKLAEAANEFLDKGQQVFVEGELRGDAVDGSQNPRIWTGNDGQSGDYREHRASSRSG